MNGHCVNCIGALLAHRQLCALLCLGRDNYALDGVKYQPVTHEGFNCPNNEYDPLACPAWKSLIDLVSACHDNTSC